MNLQRSFSSKAAIITAALACGWPWALAHAGSTVIPNIPVDMKTLATPNVLIILDNSESMDGYLGGTLVSGNDPNTRGNIGRTLMRNIIGSGLTTAGISYRQAFNWGLMSFGMTSTPSLDNTYVYYMGQAGTTMSFTDSCSGYAAGPPQVPGISVTNNNARCVANPQPFTGGNYVTFAQSSDDPSILDVLYTNGSYTSLWGLAANDGTSTDYKVYSSHSTTNSWSTGNFSGSQGTWGFTPTDSGFLPQYTTPPSPPVTSQLYLPRGWGYNANVTGSGKLNEPVQVDSTTHYNKLIALMGNETNGNTGEIKNGAVFTPTRGTLNSAGTYFSNGYQSQASPIAYSCQQNFVMLITDGLPTAQTNGSMYPYDAQHFAGFSMCNWDTTNNQWTNCGGSPGVSTTLPTAASDAIAAAGALRTTSNAIMSTNPDGTGAKSGKFDVQTYVVALGNTAANANALSIMNAMAYAGGTGQALPATDQASFSNAINFIAADILQKSGSSSAATTSTPRIQQGNNYAYATQYDSGYWWGDLTATLIDLTTGNITGGPLWHARDNLAALSSPVTSRMIISYTDAPGVSSGGVRFQPNDGSTATKLSTTQQALLNTSGASPVDGDAVLAYIRGDQGNESPNGNKYRPRIYPLSAGATTTYPHFLLGDTVHAEPVAVGGPTWAEANYSDTGFAAFKASLANRPIEVYLGANDGMLHAFDNGGNESWAYVPNQVVANLNNLTAKANWTHKYYVDATPAVADADFGSGNWHTLLVGGLGRGGRGYYALDITSPTAANEGALTAKALWEFPNSITNNSQRTLAIKNMGYSFGKPVIVKTKAQGWVVLVTSGYDNGTNAGDSGGDGLGHLYALNPQTGDLIADIPTTGCYGTPASNPCGLAQIEAFVPNVGGQVTDPTIDYVYGGDLYGNVWKFDFTGNNSKQWSASQFAVLKSSSCPLQPVTTKPLLTTVFKNGISYRYVFIGTGQYLDTTDVPGVANANCAAGQQQTVYALIDNGAAYADAHSSTPNRTLGGGMVTNAPTNCTVPMSWHMDFPNTAGTGERMVVDAALGFTEVDFNSLTPTASVCTAGGTAYHYAFDIRSGCAVNTTNNTVQTFLSNSEAFRPVIIQLPSGTLVEINQTSGSSPITTPMASGASGSTGGRRVSWRELITQ